MLAPLWIAIFIDVLGFTILFPMVGYFSELFNTSQTMIGLIFSVNAMFGFVFGPILAKLSDKYGRKPLLLISQFGTLLAFILTAFSGNLMMSETYENFMIFGLESTGEKLKLDISEDTFRLNNGENVL
ncbi:unnamed protein product, partial [marine sediment metagenome]